MDMKSLIEANNNVTEIANERCWSTGIYTNNCDCGMCDHSYECSGSDTDDDE